MLIPDFDNERAMRTTRGHLWAGGKPRHAGRALRIFRSWGQVRSAARRSPFPRPPRNNLPCGQSQILLWPAGLRLWPESFPPVASHAFWRQYFIEMPQRYIIIDATTHLRCRQNRCRAMNPTPLGRGAKATWPWQGRRLRIDVQDDAVAHNTLWRIGGRVADGKHDAVVRHSDGVGVGRHREWIAGGDRKVSQPFPPSQKSIFP